MQTKLAGLVLLGTLLTACSAVTEGQPCAVQGPNLLKNPEFGENLANWRPSQHAGNQVYELDVSDGELSINKDGDQVWFVLQQLVKAGDRVGQKMVFSADIKMALRPPEVTHAFKQGGGLQIYAESKRTISDRSRVLFRSTFNHEPKIGDSDWQTVQVVFEVPENTANLYLGFLHQADGQLWVRAPILKQVDESAAHCPETPDDEAMPTT